MKQMYKIYLSVPNLGWLLLIQTKQPYLIPFEVFAVYVNDHNLFLVQTVATPHWLH